MFRGELAIKLLLEPFRWISPQFTQSPFEYTFVLLARAPGCSFMSFLAAVTE